MFTKAGLMGKHLFLHTRIYGMVVAIKKLKPEALLGHREWLVLTMLLSYNINLS
jgi:hypothetical protein